MSETPQADPIEVHPTRLPPLGIGHLMIWMTCTAILFWQGRMSHDLRAGDFDGIGPDLPIDFATIQLLIAAVFSVFTGAAVTAVFALVRRRIRFGGSLAFQPGHWLALGYLALAITRFAGELLTNFYPELELQRPFRIEWIWVFASFLPAIVYVVGAFRTVGVVWKALFFMLSICSLAQASVFILLLYSMQLGRVITTVNTLSNYATIGVSLSVLIFAAIDYARHRHADWAHWTGVATQALAIGSIAFWMCLMLFMN